MVDNLFTLNLLYIHVVIILVDTKRNVDHYAALVIVINSLLTIYIYCFLVYKLTFYWSNRKEIQCVQLCVSVVLREAAKK